jgi:enoyl-[acyl-carrier protein] reductase I
VFTIDLSGKVAAVFGVANRRSIAYAIARHLHQAGARLAFSYQGERIREGVQGLAAGFPQAVVFPCDVSREEEIAEAFATIGREAGSLDYLVHSIAFARKEDLEGEFADTSREGFRTALEISAYSLLSLTHHALPLMEGRAGSILSLSYLAAERAVPNYNVMGTAKAALEQITRQLAGELGPAGIRINALSAGPVSTLSARGISGFTKILKVYEERSPLKRNITHDEVAKAALFLLSDMASGITGSTLHVDAGYSIMGL